jgi:hypothetical protein
MIKRCGMPGEARVRITRVYHAHCLARRVGQARGEAVGGGGEG